MKPTTSDFIAAFGVIASATAGAASWWNANRANRMEARAQNERRTSEGQKSTADLQTAEIAGWQTLIETTRSQYQQIVDQAASLQTKLDAALKTIDTMTIEASTMRGRIDKLTNEIVNLAAQLKESHDGPAA